MSRKFPGLGGKSWEGVGGKASYDWLKEGDVKIDQARVHQTAILDHICSHVFTHRLNFFHDAFRQEGTPVVYH